MKLRNVHALFIFSIIFEFITFKVNSHVSNRVFFDFAVIFLCFGWLHLKFIRILLIKASLGNKNDQPVDHPGHNDGNHETLDGQAYNRSGILLVR